MLLTPKEVAERLRVSPRTVYAWIADGRLPAVHLSERVTRVYSEAVDALFRAAPSDSVVEESRSAYCPRCGAVVDPDDARTATERLRALLNEHRDEILRLADRGKVYDVRVFGSVARGDARFGSDVDLLVKTRPGTSLFDLGGVNVAASELLGCDVHIVTEASLPPDARDEILATAVPL